MSFLQRRIKKLGGLDFKGFWDASQNSPEILSGVGKRNDYYIVSVGGNTSVDGENNWVEGDWIMFNDTTWQKIDTTDDVLTVAGRTGNVELTYQDIDGFDHGNLSGLDDDDHLQYLNRDGSRPMAGNLDLNNNDISNINKTSNKILVTSPQYTTVTTGGTLTLDDSSSTIQFLTGVAAGFNVVLPDATTISPGTNYEIYNRTSSPVVLKYSDGSTLGVISVESVASLILQNNSTSKGVFSPFTIEIAQAAGILNYSASSLTPFSTSSSVYVPITDFVVVPAAGKYAIWFNCSASSVTNNSLTYLALYRGNTIIAESERVTQSVASNFTFQMNTLAVADFDGTQELRVYVRVTTGTLTVTARTGVATRLGPIG